MSELKRVAPQTLEFSGSLNNDTKKEKKGDKDKQKNEPTFRFELIIDHTNDKGYTEFNYSHLLKSAEVSMILFFIKLFFFLFFSSM